MQSATKYALDRYTDTAGVDPDAALCMLKDDNDHRRLCLAHMNLVKEARKIDLFVHGVFTLCLSQLVFPRVIVTHCA
jgi:hypothetical protein